MTNEPITCAELKDDCLEQVAAYCGHRPWREFCALRDKLAALEAENVRLRERLDAEARLTDQANRFSEEHAGTLIAQANEIARLKDELRMTDLLLEQREKVLRAIPECPSHGACVPWALEWIASKIEGRESVNSAEWADRFARTGELPREPGVQLPDVQAGASLEPPAAPNVEGTCPTCGEDATKAAREVFEKHMGERYKTEEDLKRVTHQDWNAKPNS